MDFFRLLSLFGGLALFLYGMETMGSSLTRLSGNRLEQTLEKLTTNKYRGILLGMIVTAVIQSSSGTTVMVVGLVNSGIMKLSQAVGVIFGANVGTTVTSWILSLTGIEGGNFFVRLMKPSSFSPILALIAVVMLMRRNQKPSRKTLAGVMMGFAILMYGMETMSSAVKPLAEIPEFTQLFVLFKNPILGVIVGALLTAVIQSSSASVGILQALCATGAVSYGAAVPIIMGQNIGTCVTAMLSAIGASKNAKRAAYLHLSFNVLGTVIFMTGFYFINMLRPFAFMNESANYLGIAVLHTGFNISSTLLLLPFSKMLEKIAYLLVRDNESDTKAQDANEFKILDLRFLEQPPFAIEQAKTMMLKMADLCKRSFEEAFYLIDHYSDEGYEEVETLENRIDKYEDEINTYMIRISRLELSEKSSRELNVMISSIDDFERISDHAMNIAENAKVKAASGHEFSKQARMELFIYSKAVLEIIDLAVDSFRTFDQTKATQVEPLEQTIDSINKRLGNRHIKRMREGACTVEVGISFSDILTNMERIADHCSNVAVSIIEINSDVFDRHEYLTKVHEQEDGFGVQYRAYKEKYQLPKWDEQGHPEQLMAILEGQKF